MRLSDNVSWDRFIYGLIYPGFLGSMLYEIIPTDAADFALTDLFSYDNLIRYGIIIFYMFDYLHLYGDMDGIIQDANIKSLGYFIVDVVTCVGYVFAFITLNWLWYFPTLVVFGSVPWFFCWYKRRNPRDKRFLFAYGCVTILVLIYRGFCWKFPGLIIMSDKKLALVLVGLNVAIYGFYLFCFYEHGSRQIDVEYYRKLKEAGLAKQTSAAIKQPAEHSCPLKTKSSIPWSASVSSMTRSRS